MKIILFMITSLVVVGVLAQKPSEEKKVRQAVQSFYDAFNSHGFARAKEFTTEDWNHINPFGGWERGRDAVLKDLHEVHSTFLKGVTDTPEEMVVRFATSEVAVVTVPSRLSTFTTPDGVRHENERQIRTFIVVKRRQVANHARPEHLQTLMTRAATNFNLDLRSNYLPPRVFEFHPASAA